MLNTWPIKRATVSCLTLIVFIFALTPVARAADFSIDRFDDDITVNADGSFDVSEMLQVNFFVPRHGIYRVIPTQYQTANGDTQIVAVSDVVVVDANGAPVPSQVSNDRALQIRIGNPDVTVSGLHIYVIHYHVVGALLGFDDHDELYWNVTGTEWDTAPTEASAHVHLPVGTTLTDNDVALSCYTGVSGSKTADCTTALVGNVMMSGTSNDFLTVAFGWPKGIVTIPAPTIEQTLKGSPIDLAFLGVPLLALIFMYKRWSRYGRDPKGRVTIVAQYEPPVGMRPSEVSVLLLGKSTSVALSAAIVDLAVRGYLIIKEQKDTGTFFSSQTFTLEKKKEVDEALSEWEKKLLSGLFVDGAITATESDLKKHFSTKKPSIDAALEQHLVTQGYYDKRPMVARMPWLILGVILGFIGFQAVGMSTMVFGRPLAGFAIMAAAVIVFGFGWLMAHRTPKGVEAMEHAKGFKLFLETAEKYRLQWQEKEGIFEQYLPYAMAFGVADKWSKAFENLQISVQQPMWYVGSFAAFSAVNFTSHMNAMTSHFAAAAVPAGSGTHGGGFSGGGFGGGGGGSW